MDARRCRLRELARRVDRRGAAHGAGMDESVLRRGNDVPESMRVALPEHGLTLSPDLALVNPAARSAAPARSRPRAGHRPRATRRFGGLAATPAERMVHAASRRQVPVRGSSRTANGGCSSTRRWAASPPTPAGTRGSGGRSLRRCAPSFRCSACAASSGPRTSGCPRCSSAR